jgi:hypothetical protein
MRPTVIRLIAGCVLGTALSVALVLPGAVVLSNQAPIQHLAVPDVSGPTVIKAAPLPRPRPRPRLRPVQAPRPVEHYYAATAPTSHTVPVTRVVRRLPTPRVQTRPSGHRQVTKPRPVPRTPTRLAVSPVVETKGSTPESGEQMPSRAEKMPFRPEKAKQEEKKREKSDYARAKKERNSGEREKGKRENGERRDERAGEHDKEHGHGGENGDGSDHGGDRSDQSDDGSDHGGDG